MKKAIASLFIAAVLALTAMPVSAMENSPQEESGVVGTGIEESQYSPENLYGEWGYGDSDAPAQTLQQVERTPVGNTLRVSMMTARNLQQAESFTVTLSGKSGTKTETIVLSDGASQQNDGTVFSVEPGTYTLEISNPKYETYRQKITVKAQYNYAVQVGNGRLAGYESGSHPGVIRVGDVDQNGKLDGDDANAIVAAIEAGSKADLHCDLNGDGKVTLSDLQYLAQSMFDTEDRTSTVEKTICGDAIALAIPDSVTVTGGELENLFRDNTEMVQLEPANKASISEENPIELVFPMAEDTAVEMGGLTISGNESNRITSGSILVELEDGSTVTLAIPDPNATPATRTISGSGSLGFALAGSAIVEENSSAKWENGMLVVDFGGQVAVKKVTIVIQGTEKKNLAEISKVEFLNDMESRIPAPSMDIPASVQTTAGNKRFTAFWNDCVNVTGYEVEITDGEHTEVRRTTDTSLEVLQFNNTDLKNKTTYTIRVQSVNGQWKSGYSEPATAVPYTTEKPPKPDQLKATGEYRSISVSWKKMEDTDSYNLYYKAETDGSYTKISDIAKNSYVIDGLADQTTYEVYLTGVNENGEGPESIHSKATTIDIQPAQLPNYGLLNRSTGEGSLSEHITTATIAGNDIRKMVDSPLDGEDPKSALGIFDNSYTSYYQISDWDDGCSYYGSNKGVTVTMDEAHHIGYIAIAQAIERIELYNASVYADGKEVTGVSLVKRADANQRTYYLIKLPAEGVTATKLQICIRSFNSNGISIAEMRLYEYDSLEHDVLHLFADSLCTTLREDVTVETLDGLQDRLDTQKDGEYHMEREAIQKELDNARSIFEQKDLQKAVAIHTAITAKKDGGKGITGLNPWQPLGVSAEAGENVVVYVGSNKGKVGDNTDLWLYASQYHGESNGVAREVGRLKVGRNELTIPTQTTNDVEKGGSLYVAYAGNNQNDQYAVRVSGGVTIPVLDLYGVTDDDEWNARTLDYVKALETAVPQISDVHETAHSKTGKSYDEKNCIAGATEILMDDMLYSVSAQQILAGLSGSTEQKAAQLGDSLRAMEQMMTLYYQHKGFNDSAERQADRLPSQHLNIRYQRMFAGAFMYASGNHIGIEWDQVSLLSGGTPVESENGKYVSGQLFGWGIGHEIGHNINDSTYAVAEITNNYFAQLSTRGAETNDTARFQYPAVYDYVTSGAVGRSSNLSTALAMYWQLHLAYDRGYNYKTYDSYQEQLSNLFYARVDTYARTPGAAPTGSGSTALQLSGDRDQDFIRLASAAAEKDLTEFFTRWGLFPNQETTAYISQFKPESRAIYYSNDASRVYEIENGGTSGTILGQDILNGNMKAKVDADTKNDVTINLGNKAENGIVYGYEITRCTISGGETEEQVVGFTTEDSFTDHVTSINNRVVTYKVTAIDQFMNRSKSKTLSPVKIEHDGDHDKSLWNVELSNIVPVTSNKAETNNDYPDEETVDDGRANIIDNKKDTVFVGTASGNEAAVVLNFHRTLPVTGIRYRANGENSVGGYQVQVSQDQQNWQTVAAGTFANDGDQVVYFQNENGWIATYDAVCLKLVITGKNGQKIEIPELDVLGPTGDNVDFIAADDGQPVIGLLAEDYIYEKASGDAGKDQVIPKGSLVFVGKYKGNPAYNVGILYDENGQVVGGLTKDGALKAEQIILADVPEQGELGETYDGRWIYWITPENLDENNLPKKVRAELYRVDDALTNEGQRLVSDSLFYEMPSELPTVHFENP